jgi:hypothetical protein
MVIMCQCTPEIKTPICPNCPDWETWIGNPNRKYNGTHENGIRQCTYGLKSRWSHDISYCTYVEGHTVPHMTHSGITLEDKHAYWMDTETPAEKLLLRLFQWGMWDALADGPYWKAEINKVLEK